MKIDTFETVGIQGLDGKPGTLGIPESGGRDKPTSPRQSLSLKPGGQYDLGNINGKPFKLRLFEDREFEWSGGLRLTELPAPDSKVSAQAKAAAAAMDRYSDGEWRVGHAVAGIVFNLHLISQGKQSADGLNKMFDDDPFQGKFLAEAISRLGIDASQPFEMNGSAFSVRGGRLYPVVDAQA